MFMKLTSFSIQDKNFPVLITRKRIKRIVLRIDRNEGITVSCPFFCSDQVISEFLEKNRPWLEKSLHIQEVNDSLLGVSDCINYEKTYLLGKPYLLKQNSDLKQTFSIGDGIIYYKDNPITALDKVRRNYYPYLEAEFASVYRAFSDKIKQKPFLTIRKMKTRWGSCNHKTGRITINRVLVQLPPHLLHLVMVHEFSHLLFPNHGRTFKDFLKKQIPNYRESEKELKKYAFLLKIN